MGVLEPVIRDTNIEDISCSGVGNIFVEHKIFGGLRTGISFDTEEELDKYVIQLADGIKHPVTFRNPCVDATLAGWFSYQHGLRNRCLQKRQQLHH